MEVLINGERETIDVFTLSELLEHKGWRREGVVIAVNYRCIPRSEYEKTMLAANDEIEILSAQQGG